jgi:hypothetical protein
MRPDLDYRLPRGLAANQLRDAGSGIAVSDTMSLAVQYLLGFAVVSAIIIGALACIFGAMVLFGLWSEK